MPNAHRASKIMLIRHAEKPSGDDLGVSQTGTANAKSLSVRGWQRAGALTAYFMPSERHGIIAQPQFLFASHSSSLRPHYSLVPLAQKLGIAVNLDYGKGEEDRLIATASALDGVVLISWQHDFMSKVANAILEDEQTAPQNWPSARFDMTWVFDLDPQSLRYGFTQAPQQLLAEDSSQAI